jgi:TonB family protein
MMRLDAAFESAAQAWIVSYLLNSLWQVPLVYGAAFITAHIARPAGPRVEHRIWVGALLVQIALPACALRIGDIGQRLLAAVLALVQGGAANGQTRIMQGPGFIEGMTLWGRMGAGFTAATLAYLASLLYFVGRLAWGAWVANSMRRKAVTLRLDPEIAERAFLLERSFGMKRGPVRMASLPRLSGPATIGFTRPTLLLPEGFLSRLDAAELDALLAHEFAHMQRADFAKNLLYGFLSIPVAYHPLLWLTRTRVAETRELVCDAMAADAVGGRESYARSLLRLASRLSDRPTREKLHAIGIFDANIFERRVMNLTRRSREISGLRKAAIAATCAVVAFGACGTALALRMDVDQPSGQSSTPKRISMNVTKMTIVSKVPPVYPAEAKKKGIKGRVDVATVIGKDGSVEEAHAVSGPSELQDSAVNSIKQWRYQPVLLNGDPVEVDTTISVIYSLAK